MSDWVVFPDGRRGRLAWARDADRAGHFQSMLAGAHGDPRRPRCDCVVGEQERACVFPLIRRTEAVARAAAHFPLDRHIERIARIPAGLSGWRTLDCDPPYAYSAIRLDDTGTGGEVLVHSPFLARTTLFEDVDSVGAFGRKRVLPFGELHALQDDLPNWVSAGWSAGPGAGRGGE